MRLQICIDFDKRLYQMYFFVIKNKIDYKYTLKKEQNYGNIAKGSSLCCY